MRMTAFVFRQVLDCVEVNKRWEHIWSDEPKAWRSFAFCFGCCYIIWWSVCPIWILGWWLAIVELAAVSRAYLFRSVAYNVSYLMTALGCNHKVAKSINNIYIRGGQTCSMYESHIVKTKLQRAAT